ncbi:alpha/beta hydrolase [Novosphingobium sp. PS1R-30]|uniref:Alpha/beta hydrolase n=1 Tax=Novosphingobium anseongense TaxID=3133436 RepID=A0ABU8RY57_9SPHN
MKTAILATLLAFAATPTLAWAGAVDAPTRFVEAEGRRLAYRAVGTGRPLILALRFRGTLDSWDPAFIDALAKDFRVITFEYSGIGRSTGARAGTMEAMVDDVRDLADGLKIDRFVLGGWSMGGAVVQEAATRMPDRVSHLVVIAAGPPGQAFWVPEKAFLDAASKPVNDLADEEVLFFRPSSEVSRAAAKASWDRIHARTGDLSPPVIPAAFADQAKAVADFRADTHGVSQFLFTTRMPILVVAGDRDVCCRVEDWFALSGRLATTRLLVMPQAGHGPQHQYPEEVAAQIAVFAKP